ncbi:MAG: ATP-dependent DNA ligase [Coriobacteriia bacterium]|jgi:DNA ligase-1|nr:ATP-dependent DNA ligase [Coriobacteriia bacterium]
MTFKPMLAETCEDIELLQYPVIASPKLDGIRCLIVDGVAVSRTLKPIRNTAVQAWVKANANLLNGLDGELISGDHDATVFQRTTSVVMSADGGPEFTFWVFDIWSCAFGYKARIAALKELTEGVSNIKLVPTRTCRTPDELRSFEEACLARGFEGVMVRRPDGVYKNGRSTLKEALLLKIKRFTDAEATVIGWGERMHNENPEERDATGKMDRSTHRDGLRPAGDLGYLLVRAEDGTCFKIGSGFTAAQRVELWKVKDSLMNQLVKYKFFEQGMKDAPRFPVFLGLRDRDDV